MQNFGKAVDVPLLQSVEVTTPAKDGAPEKKETITTQALPQGPAASQVAIKQLGTNGGGFFNVNSAHPYENPTPLSNFVEVLSILLISAAPLLHLRHAWSNDPRQGWAIYAAMSVDLSALALRRDRRRGDSRIRACPRSASKTSAGNLEGKEVRFGAATSALWATATTAASNGSVNSMHDSYTPLGGLVPMWLMQLGEVIFGGVGSGLYGMLVFAIIAVFIAGLMVGRTPEYLGKKIEAYEMKMASLVILIPPFVVLVGTALAVVIEPGVSSMSNPGVHGFSQVLYAFSSAGNNNGSAFAGLSANTPFYNSALGVAMWLVALLADRAGAGHRRQPGRQEVRAGVERNAADAHAAVRRAADRHGAAGRRADLRAGAGAGADRRAPDALCGEVRQELDMSTHKHKIHTFDPALLGGAVVDSLQASDADGAVAQSGDVRHLAGRAADRGARGASNATASPRAISLWLWFTVLFANFAEALAEGRGKAQAASLRGAKKDTPAIKLDGTRRDAPRSRGRLEPTAQGRCGAGRSRPARSPATAT